jgi:hypothetical protein
MLSAKRRLRAVLLDHLGEDAMLAIAVIDMDTRSPESPLRRRDLAPRLTESTASAAAANVARFMVTLL